MSQEVPHTVQSTIWTHPGPLPYVLSITSFGHLITGIRFLLRWTHLNEHFDACYPLEGQQQE